MATQFDRFTRGILEPGTDDAGVGGQKKGLLGGFDRLASIW
jgi:hypothetical protein